VAKEPTGFEISAPSMDYNSILTTVSGLGVAAYGIAVVIQGNGSQLVSMLKQEEGYLEFAIAIIAIGLLTKYGPTGPITDLLVVGVLLGLLFRISSNIDLGSIMTKFANGQATMAQTAQAIIAAL